METKNPKAQDSHWQNILQSSSPNMGQQRRWKHRNYTCITEKNQRQNRLLYDENDEARFRLLLAIQARPNDWGPVPKEMYFSRDSGRSARDGSRNDASPEVYWRPQRGRRVDSPFDGRSRKWADAPSDLPWGQTARTNPENTHPL